LGADQWETAAAVIKKQKLRESTTAKVSQTGSCNTFLSGGGQIAVNGKGKMLSGDLFYRVKMVTLNCHWSTVERFQGGHRKEKCDKVTGIQVTGVEEREEKNSQGIGRGGLWTFFCFRGFASL